MKISSDTRRFLTAAMAVTAAVALAACKSTPPAVAAAPAPVATPTKPPAETPKPADKKEFSRLEFATELDKLLAARKYDEAVASFDSVPESETSSIPMLKIKLAVLISASRLDEATAVAERLEKAAPTDADVLYSRSILAGARGDQAAKAKYLTRTIQAEPDHSDAHTSLGLGKLSSGDYEGAKAHFVRASAANPANTDALLGLARVYYMKEDLPRARDTLDAALEKETRHGSIWAERARVRSETGDLPGAIQDARKAVELEPLVYGNWVDMGTYYISAGKKRDAREAFGEAIKIDPAQYLAYIYRAGLNDDLENTDEAVADYRMVCKLYPRYYYAAEALGILLWGKGDYAGSRDAFRLALTHSPNNPYYALLYALCYFREGKNAEGKEFMANYIKTMNRESTEYFLCRLFVDKSGEADVLNRITKEKKAVARNRMLFYAAEYYDIFQNKDIAQKYYLEIIATPSPSFFEYRLSKWAVTRPENANGKTGGDSPKS